MNQIISDGKTNMIENCSEVTIGLEIHQQLDLPTKLFCECAVSLSDGAVEKRMMRRTFSLISAVLENIDKSILENVTTTKIEYQGDEQRVCDVEMDESPPFAVSPAALRCSLIASMLFRSEILREQKIMRKIISDGSCPCGFQRTILVGIGGHLDLNEKRYSIPRIFLEEDSARKVVSNVYSLNRIGTPLLEIVTGPEIRSAKEAVRVAKEITNTIFFLQGFSSRLGAIRQDVNISILGHPRCELKGVDSLSLLESAITKEIDRQKMMLSIFSKIRLNKHIEIIRPLDDREQEFLQRLAHEHDSMISDNNILCSQKLIQYVKRSLVDGDTRHVLSDGESIFLRAISTHTRMYPETDLDTISITDKMIRNISEQIPITKTVAIQKLKDLRIRDDLVNVILEKGLFSLVLALSNQYDSSRICSLLIQYLTTGNKERTVPDQKVIEYLFEKVRSLSLMIKYLDKSNGDYQTIVDLFEQNRSKNVLKEVRLAIDRVITENSLKLQKMSSSNQRGFVLGLISKEYALVEPKTLIDIIEKSI